MRSRVRASEQRSMTACPDKFFRSAGAPACSSRATMSWRPMKTAVCRGVQPAMSMPVSALWPGLLFSSSRMYSSTIAKEPLRHAAWRHVVPLLSQANRLAPKVSSHRTAMRFEPEENNINCLSMSFRSSRFSAKTAPAGSQWCPSSSVGSLRSLMEMRVQLSVHRSLLSLHKTWFPIVQDVALCDPDCPCNPAALPHASVTQAYTGSVAPAATRHLRMPVGHQGHAREMRAFTLIWH
mmetsp:Transcript_148051/g.369066  ORF Transcript_148051/g.369066 Transcript_148051/m.369066 type:complete len:237 (+) Transcript_148051:1565-2275(+)